MNILGEILATYPDEQIIVCEGFDKCVIGYDYGDGTYIRLIYSVSKILKQMEHDGLSIDEAISLFEREMRSQYSGEDAPIFCQDDL